MHEDLLSDIDVEDVQNAPDAWWRKPLLVFAALVLLALIVSLSFLGTLTNLAPSKPVQNNILEFPNATVVFKGGTLQQLQNEYLQNQEREIKACLFGSVDDNIYAVDSVSFPEIASANALHVRADACPSNTLIDLHSHPLNKCLASSQDLGALEMLKKRNPGIRMLVMCSLNRFALV